MRYITILLIVLGTIACKSKKTMATADASKAQQVLELTKTPCFGTCPSFTLKIYANGLAVLDGKKHIEPIGLSHMMLSDKQMSSLMNTCEDAQLFSLKDDYTERVMDLPTTTLTYIKDSKTKRIGGNMNFPDGFKKVVDTCMKIVKMEGWELKEAYNVK